MNEIVILGAGITGISVAYHIQQKRKNCTIYEANNRYGGLIDNFSINGFLFDKAVHLSFTQDKYVRSLFDKTEYALHYPTPCNFEAGRWLKHPVQNNLFSLPVEDKIKAIKSFIERPGTGPVNSYHEWLVQQFGSYITGRFPHKYTKKYWTIQAEYLGTEWVGNRLYRPSLDEVLLGAMTDQTPNTYYAQEMRYPSCGGYKAFIAPLAAACDIRTGKKAVCIDPELKYIQFDSGELIYYEHLVSTIPLPDLIKIMKNVPASINQIADELWATSVALVSIGFNRPDVPPNLWFYIYDEDILPARAYSPSLKSPRNAPIGCSSLQFEIYYSRYKPLPLQQEKLIDNVIDFMEKAKIATEKDVAVTDCRIVPYANVVFEKGMVEKRKIVIDYLKTRGIYVAGRFGEWDYLWSDQCLLSGKRVAERLCQKK